MKKVLLILFLILGFNKVHSQAVIQTYVDRCTGQVYVFTVPMNGQAVIVFYDRSATFTADDVQNGTLQAWLEQTYQWWSSLNPCSTNQATTTATQQTAQTAASNATAAATNATASVPSSPPTNATQTNSSGTSSTGTSSSDTNQNTQTESNSSNSSGESSGGSEGSSETSKEETTTEESSETSSEESSESDSEESVEEESSEEKKEEKKKEEEKKEEEKKKEKKKTLAPPVVSANLMTMSMIDGSLSTAGSFGYSQSSLTGVDTYAANGMLWSNLRQYTVTLSKSTVFFRYDKEVPLMIVDPETGKRHQFGSYMGKGSVDFVYSESFTYMNMFGTHLLMGGFSNVFLGKPNSKWEGFVGGVATNVMLMFPKFSDAMASLSLTFFGSKPFKIKGLDRYSFTPMLAYSSSPISFTPKTGKVMLTQHGTYVIGNSVNINLTQRFVANIGGTLIGSTLPNFPFSYAITIGSRFAF